MFTRASVHWAERIVATSSSSALEWLRAHLASGYARSRRATIFVARVRTSAGDSRRRLRFGARAARLNVLFMGSGRNLTGYAWAGTHRAPARRRGSPRRA